MNNRVQNCFVLLAITCCIGCSDPTKGVVSGAITIDGEPPESGYITFFPVDGKGTAGSDEIEAGAYEATVPVGLCRVEIRVSEVVGTTRLYNTRDSPTADVRQEILPPKYNDKSELTYNVPPGRSQKDFALKRIPRK